MNGAAAQQRIHAPAGQRFPKHRNTGFLNAGTAVSKLPDWRFPGAGILNTWTVPIIGDSKILVILFELFLCHYLFPFALLCDLQSI